MLVLSHHTSYVHVHLVIDLGREVAVVDRVTAVAQASVLQEFRSIFLGTFAGFIMGRFCNNQRNFDPLSNRRTREQVSTVLEKRGFARLCYADCVSLLGRRERAPEVRPFIAEAPSLASSKRWGKCSGLEFNSFRIGNVVDLYREYLEIFSKLQTLLPRCCVGRSSNLGSKERFVTKR